jgi:two-component system alkaline phosphatase synthesis response regulator PhoP
MPSVLIVEDDEAMSVALRDGFASEGYSVRAARDGEAGLRAAQGEPPDLLILDVMLPRMTGLDVCRELRARGNAVPIIMLTARGQEIDKVVGLRTGADDYVAKPFGFMELIARSEALLRRTGSGGIGSHRGRPPGPLRIGDLVVDFQRHEAHRESAGGGAGGTSRIPVELSAREFRLLAFFASRRGEVVTRESLLDAVWETRGAPLTRTVDMHVAKLRKKIEPEPREPRHLLTVHGLGYKLTDL